MPSKRYLRRPVDILTPTEVAALLAAPDLNIWSGRRDRALLLMAVQTGLRASELLCLHCQDLVLGPGAHVRCQGKGRKVRNTPLRKEASRFCEVGFPGPGLRTCLSDQSCARYGAE